LPAFGGPSNILRRAIQKKRIPIGKSAQMLNKECWRMEKKRVIKYNYST